EVAEHGQTRRTGDRGAGETVPRRGRVADDGHALAVIRRQRQRAITRYRDEAVEAVRHFGITVRNVGFPGPVLERQLAAQAAEQLIRLRIVDRAARTDEIHHLVELPRSTRVRATAVEQRPKLGGYR